MKFYRNLLMAFSFTMITGLAHAGINQVSFQSDYVFELPGGYNSTATYTGNEISNFEIYTRDDTHDGVVDAFEVTGNGNNDQDFWNITFSTAQLGQNITPGTYSGVGPYPFESPGQAGFDADITGVGLSTDSSNYYGTVKIIDFTYDYSEPGTISPNVPDPRVISLAAEFNITDTTNNNDILNGHIYYNYNPVVTPEPPSLLLLLMGCGMMLLFSCFRQLKVPYSAIDNE